MKILVIGGTRFVGRHIVDAALARGHDVAVFHRGKTGQDIPKEVERIVGERDSNLKPLGGRRWDVVIDTCGYVPRVVGTSAAILADAVDHYIFLSSLSVYCDWSTPGIDETAPVAVLADSRIEEVTAETYGALKVLCERVLDREMGGRTTSLRAGPIVGPHDNIQRFIYWVRRVADGGTVLAPGRPERQIQLIDARDLGDWAVRLAESKTPGIFNTVGPDSPLTMREVLETIRRVSGSDARFVWASDEFLKTEGVEPWTDLPFWMPEEGDTLHFFKHDIRKALDAGLTFRPFDETVRDVLAWDRANGRKPFIKGDDSVAPKPPAIEPEREAELLAKLATQ